MKKRILMLGITLCIFFPCSVFAQEKITLYFFHGSTCPHCALAKEYLNEVKRSYPKLEIVGYEVWEDENNASLLSEVRRVLSSESRGVPFFVVGERYLTGFGKGRKQDIIDALDYYEDHESEYQDVVAKVLRGELKPTEENKEVAYVHPVSLNEEHKKKDIIHLIGCGVLIVLLAILYIVLGKTNKNRM